MEHYFPKTAPEGFKSFIVAFEFARTPEQINILLKDFSPEVIKNIDIGNYFDFAFMLSYSLFLFLFFRTAARVFNKKWLYAEMFISIIVLLADFSENLCLLNITGLYTAGTNHSELIPVLKLLHIFTWIKWTGLTVVFALFSANLFGRNILLSSKGIVLILPSVLFFWASTNDAMGISNFTLSVIIAFLLLLFFSFWHKKQPSELSDEK